MLDQKKSGQFISDMRKEKGLTQKQLADEIGVSDKAISRWETGRGMPDTSIMPELCKKLDINVNELLSGEHLSTENYSGKAEDNMVELIRNNEDEKKFGRNAVLGTLLGVVLMCTFIFLITGISGGSLGSIMWFLDAPSIIAVLGIQLIMLGASGQFVNFFRSFKLVFSSKSYSTQELTVLAEKCEYAVGYGIKATLLAGLITSIIGIVFLFGHLDTPETLGPTLAVAVLTLFYAALISVILFIFKGRLHRFYS